MSRRTAMVVYNVYCIWYFVFKYPGTSTEFTVPSNFTSKSTNRQTITKPIIKFYNKEGLVRFSSSTQTAFYCLKYQWSLWLKCFFVVISPQHTVPTLFPTVLQVQVVQFERDAGRTFVVSLCIVVKIMLM